MKNYERHWTPGKELKSSYNYTAETIMLAVFVVILLFVIVN